ncbi:hypothetical protein MMC07_009500, partial [Pseudocyphellaria aurata]|nr:hypothetical protein [Pseudocyphellaria aurata]
PPTQLVTWVETMARLISQGLISPGLGRESFWDDEGNPAIQAIDHLDARDRARFMGTSHVSTDGMYGRWIRREDVVFGVVWGGPEWFVIRVAGVRGLT